MNHFNLSWKVYLQKFPKITANQQIIGRVISEHKTDWDIITEQSLSSQKAWLPTTSRLQNDPDQLPKVGDFVLLDHSPENSQLTITRVLPRFSVLSRLKQDSEQILATNINTIFIIVAYDQPLNLQQLKRYIAMALEGNSQPIIVLNKKDIAQSTDTHKSEIQTALPQTPVIEISAKTQLGLESLQTYLEPGTTVVLVGLSGSGKSTLVNALLDQKTQSTQSVNKEGLGKHTTTRREMFFLSNGSCLIDSPGIRTLEQQISNQTTAKMFEQIAQLTENCKFRNCDHSKSEGCAVLQALQNQEISEQEYQDYLLFLNPPNNLSQKKLVQSARRTKRKIKPKQN
ncbi:MAG: ribosome small subunit-dependent GTPase A [Candidatus Doudnabacteria bacterium]